MSKWDTFNGLKYGVSFQLPYIVGVYLRQEAEKRHMNVDEYVSDMVVKSLPSEPDKATETRARKEVGEAMIEIRCTQGTLEHRNKKDNEIEYREMGIIRRNADQGNSNE
jgi:hypothetical protein